jgi:hypothetical protein
MKPVSPKVDVVMSNAVEELPALSKKDDDKVSAEMCELNFHIDLFLFEGRG